MWSTAGLRDQRQRDAGRIRRDHRRILALERLVAFDALLVLVAGLAFLDDDLGAADAAVTRVEHVEVVVHAVGDRNAGIGERAGAVGEQRYEESRRRPARPGRKRRPGSQRPRRERSVSSAFVSPLYLPVLACPGVCRSSPHPRGYPRPRASAPDRGIGPSVPFNRGKATP